MCKGFREILGKSIKNIRQEIGFTQEELALESTVSRSHIAMIETGKRDVTIDTLFRISRALKTDFKKLFAFDDINKFRFDIENFYK